MLRKTREAVKRAFFLIFWYTNHIITLSLIIPILVRVFIIVGDDDDDDGSISF